MISYEYSKPVPSVTVGQNVNWEELLKNLPVDMINGLTVTKNTSSDYDTTIDLSSLGEEFSDVILKQENIFWGQEQYMAANIRILSQIMWYSMEISGQYMRQPISA